MGAQQVKSKAAQQMEEHDKYVEEKRPKRDAPHLSCGSHCSKITLIVMNTFFLILGAVICGVGGWALDSTTTQIATKSVVVGIIVLGSFVMVMAFLGCCGAKFESRPALCIYGVLLVLLIIIQIGLASAALADSDNAATWLEKGWEDASNNLRIDLQNAFSCCGLRGYNDSLAGVPCPLPEPPAPANSTLPSCIDKLKTDLKDKIKALGAVALVFAFLQVMGVVFAFWLRKAVTEARYSLEEDPHKDQPTR